jgi:hypothetical protein
MRSNSFATRSRLTSSFRSFALSRRMIFGSALAISDPQWRFISRGSQSGQPSKASCPLLKKSLHRLVPDPLGPNFLPCCPLDSRRVMQRCPTTRRCSHNTIRTESSVTNLSVKTSTADNRGRALALRQITKADFLTKQKKTKPLQMSIVAIMDGERLFGGLQKQTAQS